MASFILAPTSNYDLGNLLAAYRQQINDLCQKLDKDGTAKGGIKVGASDHHEEYIVVVRTHEDPHTHPNNDLIFVVLEGSGYLETASVKKLPLKTGDTAVIPMGGCHAFHNNTPDGFAVLFATFTPSPPHTEGSC